MQSVVIIGSGPAGYTAGIYAARLGLSAVLFEGDPLCSSPPGGQLMNTTEVENFPGFPEGILGPDLMDLFKRQCIKSGCAIERRRVLRIEQKENFFHVEGDGASCESKSVIIATGATAKRLGMKGEELFWQKGISACAVCDGPLPVYKNQVVAVVGGGDAACQEIEVLSKFASKILMVVRSSQLRASFAMQNKILQNPKVEILWETQIIEATGSKYLESITVVQKGIEKKISVKGIFYALGHIPNTNFLQGFVKLTESGYIVTQPGTTKTSVIGVFASGDVQDFVYRQAITAAGTGCMAAMDAYHYVSSCK